MPIEKINLEVQVEDAAVHAGGLLRSKYGLWAVAGISFLEAALPVPFITDPFLIAYILADKKSALKGTLVTLVASVFGGIVAYMLAFSFYELITQTYLVDTTGTQFSSLVTKLQGGTFVVTLLGAVTPIPYTLVAYGAGFVKGSLPLFILASIIGRGGRYTIVGFATYSVGEQAIALIKKRILVVSAVSILVVGTYLLYKFL